MELCISSGERERAARFSCSNDFTSSQELFLLRERRQGGLNKGVGKTWSGKEWWSLDDEEEDEGEVGECLAEKQAFCSSTTEEEEGPRRAFHSQSPASLNKMALKETTQGKF